MLYVDRLANSMIPRWQDHTNRRQRGFTAALQLSNKLYPPALNVLTMRDALIMDRICVTPFYFITRMREHTAYTRDVTAPLHSSAPRFRLSIRFELSIVNEVETQT